MFVNPEEVELHPENPRRGNLKVLKKSIKENGFIAPIVLQKGSDIVVAGNHRVLAARSLGIDSIPARRIEMSDAQALRILLADNRVSDESIYNEEVLAGVLKGLLEESDDSLEGTGYSTKEANIIIERAAWQKEIKNVDLGTELPPEEREDEEDEDHTDSVQSRDGVAHAEKNKDRIERLNAIAKRTITLSIPVAKHPEFVAGMAQLRSEYGVATNEEALAAMLVEHGFVDEDFVLVEESKPKNKKNKKGKK